MTVEAKSDWRRGAANAQVLPRNWERSPWMGERECTPVALQALPVCRGMLLKTAEYCSGCEVQFYRRAKCSLEY